MEAMKREDFEDNSKDVDMGFAAVDDSFLKEKMSNDKIEKGSISTDDVIAQALLFFLAGFETVAVLLSHCLNELAVNPDIQKKLQDEIDKELEKSDEKDLNYEAVVGMKYLDMVISGKDA